MGIGVGGNYSNKTKTVREIKDTQGKVVGRITISKPKSKTVRKKRLPYNFRKISNQIVMSKTANSARAAMSSARRVTLLLKEKMRSSDYSDEELKDAIIHARKMERIAKKRVKNMEAEERAAQSGVYILELEEEETSESEHAEKEQQEETGLTQEELEKMMQELESLMEESMEELEEAAGLEDFMDGMMCVVQKDMEPEDLEQLKKKHRAEELQEIMEADMKYLKALFNRLEREKREGVSGSSNNGSSPSVQSTQSDSARGVSLQLAGTDIPVEQTAEVPAAAIAEAASVDIVL